MIDRTKRLGRLGNAVVPMCAEFIGKQILQFQDAAGVLRREQRVLDTSVDANRCNQLLRESE